MKKDPATYGFLWINKGDTFVLGTDNAFYAKAIALCARPFKATIRQRWSRLSQAQRDDLLLESVEAMWANQCNGRLDSLTNSTVLTYLLTIGLRNAGKVKADLHSELMVADEGSTDGEVLSMEQWKERLARYKAEAFSQLRERDRELIHLFHVQGLSMEEMALRLDYGSVNSVKKAKCVAFKKLRKGSWDLYREGEGCWRRVA